MLIDILIHHQQLPRDIDIQTHTNSLAVEWHGFEHSHLHVIYKVGFGTLPGQSDVSNGYKVVDNDGDTVFELKEMTLEPFQVNYDLYNRTYWQS